MAASCKLAVCLWSPIPVCVLSPCIIVKEHCGTHRQQPCEESEIRSGRNPRLITLSGSRDAMGRKEGNGAVETNRSGQTNSTTLRSGYAEAPWHFRGR